MIEVQAKWVASVLSGKVILPPKEEMLHDVEQHYRLMEENRIPKHHTHRLPLDPVIKVPEIIHGCLLVPLDLLRCRCLNTL